MDKERRYGFCEWTKKWVPRDEMYGATIRFYNRDGTEQRIPLRFSREGMDIFLAEMRQFEWKNDLQTAQDLREQGLLSESV